MPADQRPQQQGRQHRPGGLDRYVGGDPLPREVAAQREGEADRRVQVRSRHSAHEQDDCGHGQCGRHHERGAAGDMTAEPGVHHAAARRGEDEEERPEQLGEQPAPFVAVIQEVELPPCRVRHPDRAQGSGDMTGHLCLCPVLALLAELALLAVLGTRTCSGRWRPG